jgi:biopolymer transport protein TolR
MQMAIGATGRGEKAIAVINVTPMADIMIVLLIIFMVITPLLDEDGVRLPAAANAVFIRAAGAVPYSRVVEAVDTARGAGADRIGLVPGTRD